MKTSLSTKNTFFGFFARAIDLMNSDPAILAINGEDDNIPYVVVRGTNKFQMYVEAFDLRFEQSH